MFSQTIYTPVGKPRVDYATVGFAFYQAPKQVKRKGSIMSRLMQANQEYWHVEFAVPPDALPDDDPMKNTGGKNQVLAFGIMARDPDRRDASGKPLPGKVFKKWRVFSSTQYKWSWCEVDVANLKRAIQFANKQIGKPYDARGHYALLWNPRESTVDSKAWYCTNLAVAIGQQAIPELRCLHPGAVSTDQLRERLLRHPRTSFRMPPTLAQQADRENEKARNEMRMLPRRAAAQMSRENGIDYTGKSVKPYS